MVDRIDKTDRAEYWRVAASTEAQKDKEQREEQGAADTFAALNDKTDWQLLFSKSSLWKRNIQVAQDEIKTIIYHKINLKTDPSLLRIDIVLTGGGIISPAFVAISRGTGLRIKDLKSGDPIPPEMIFRGASGNILRITVPTNPELFKNEGQKKSATDQKEAPLQGGLELTVKTAPVRRSRFFDGPEHSWIYALLLLLGLLLIGGLFLI